MKPKKTPEKSPALQQLEIEAGNIAKFGEATPTPQTGGLTQFTDGFGTDATGRIFRVDEGASDPVISSDDVAAEFDQSKLDLDEKIDSSFGDTTTPERKSGDGGGGDPNFNEGAGRVEASEGDAVANELSAWQQ